MHLKQEQVDIIVDQLSNEAEGQWGEFIHGVRDNISAIKSAWQKFKRKHFPREFTLYHSEVTHRDPKRFCIKCNGHGKSRILQLRCEPCDGTGKGKCPKCAGTNKKNSCKRCGGSGYYVEAVSQAASTGNRPRMLITKKIGPTTRRLRRIGPTTVTIDVVSQK